MPLRKQYRKRRAYRKRPMAMTRRGRYGAKTTKSIISTSLVRPEKLRVRLPYSDYYTLVAPAGGIGSTRSWNLNSIWDPDRTGIGHSVLGWTEWNALYTKYRVYGMSYDISLTNYSDVTSIAGSLSSTSYVPAAAFSDTSIFEQPKTRKFQIGNKSGISTTKLKGYVKLPFVVGQTNEQYRTDDQNNTAPFNGSPFQQACLNLNLLSMNTTEAAAVTCYIRVVYHVELLDARQIVSSSPIGDREPGPSSM